MEGEDFDAYFGGDFAVTGVIAGVDVPGIFGTEPVEDPTGLLTMAPTFRIATRTVAIGASCIVNAVPHVVRRVEPVGPDGATLRLVLART